MTYLKCNTQIHQYGTFELQFTLNENQHIDITYFKK